MLIFISSNVALSKASYNGVIAKEEVVIIVVEAQEYDTISVKEAIESEDGTVVFLRGLLYHLLLIKQDSTYLMVQELLQ